MPTEGLSQANPPKRPIWTCPPPYLYVCINTRHLQWHPSSLHPSSRLPISAKSCFPKPHFPTHQHENSSRALWDKPAGLSTPTPSPTKDQPAASQQLQERQDGEVTIPGIQGQSLSEQESSILLPQLNSYCASPSCQHFLKAKPPQNV